MKTKIKFSSASIFTVNLLFWMGANGFAQGTSPGSAVAPAQAPSAIANQYSDADLKTLDFFSGNGISYSDLLYQYGNAVGNPDGHQVPNYALPQVRTFPTKPKDVQAMQKALPPVPATMSEIPTAPLNQSVTTAPASAKAPIASQVPAATDAPNPLDLNHAILQNAGQELAAKNATACLAKVSNVNSSCTNPTIVASTPDPVGPAPAVINSCSARVSVPGDHTYMSEFMQKIVSAPKAIPPALFGLSADLGSASVAAGGEAMYVSKSTDGGKTWTKVSTLGPDKFDSYQDGLYNGLSVSDDGSNIVVTTSKGAFPLTQNGAKYDASLPALEPASATQAVAGDVKMSPDGQHMAVTYAGTYGSTHVSDIPTRIVSYKKVNGAWQKDEVSALPDSRGVLMNLQYDPSGKLYAETGEQAFTYDPTSNAWKQFPIMVSKTVTVNGVKKTVLHAATDISVYDMTFSASTDSSGKTQYKPDLLATCWGTIDVQKHTVSHVRAYDVQVNPKNPKQVIRTTHDGADYSNDGGKTWKKVSGLPDCESITAPGKFITTSDASCAAMRSGNSAAILARADKNIVPAEFRTAHFNDDGSVLISGASGTFLTTPFAAGCPQ